jgi:amino acid adenylation domain-containing protein
MVEVLRARALWEPGREIFSYLVDGESQEARLTLAALDEQARAIAALLQSLGAARERVLLLYPPGLEYIAAFFGCLYAGAVAAPTYPPKLNQTLSRLEAIVSDARAAFALTTGQTLRRVAPLIEGSHGLRGLRWAATDEIDLGLAAEWRDPHADGDSLAFIQYTSGSTSKPKGVMLSHANLLENERLIRRAFGQTERSLVVGWLPLYHDMGLIGNVLQSLYSNARCVLMSPASFLQSPARWLRAVSKYRADTSGGPNFAYDLCARKVTEEERTGLDLSSWSVAFNGSEPIRHDTLDRFADAFAPCGFRREAFFPCYGLAEATLFVSGGPRSGAPSVFAADRKALEGNRALAADAGEALKIVSCGRAWQGQEFLIVDPRLSEPCAEGVVGEVWVAGRSVARGYWGRGEESADCFGARLAGTSEGPYLRTGDMGFVMGGELFLTGRLKDLIIIRGRNHYPQDIEQTVEQSCPGLRHGCGAAFTADVWGQERLVVVQEVERGRRAPDADHAARAIRRAVSREHELQVYSVVLIQAGSIPKTTSGKLQRRACRDAFLAGGLKIFAERRSRLDEGGGQNLAGPLDASPEAIEEFLVTRLARMLGVEPGEVSAHEALAAYGVDSLMALDLAHSLGNGLGVSLPALDFLQSPSIEHLASQLSEQARAAAHMVTPPPSDSSDTQEQLSPLSHGQRALWFLHQLAPESPAYNLAGAARIRARLDVRALERAFQSLVDRHPSLRTTFVVRDDHAAQLVHGRAQVCFRHESVPEGGEPPLAELLSEEAHRPFDLEQGPLMRVSLFQTAEDDYTILLVIHHIVADFWSIALLVKELGEFYRAETTGASPALIPLKASYADYARRQSEALAGPEGERLWDYWRRELEHAPAVLSLTGDRPRPPVQTYAGAAHAFRLPTPLTMRLKTLAAENAATLYVLLLAAFQILLRRYTGQDDFLVGSPVSGRERAEWAGVVGYFVNPLALRARFEGSQSFVELMGDLHRSVLDARRHQDYPFALLVERLQPERDLSCSPLFQVMFTSPHSPAFSGADLRAFAVGGSAGGLDVGGVLWEPSPLELRASQFDLTLMAAEAGDEVAASFQYNTDLFDAVTVERMALHFRTLLEDIAAHPEKKVANLRLLPAEEWRGLVVELNDTTRVLHGPVAVHRCFEEQAERTPDAVALVFEDEQMTYGELNRRANALARRLKKLCASEELRVGICLERSPQMLVALLGVLKAGGAYVPLDPSYPLPRLEWILEDAAAPVLLTQRSLTGLFPEGRCRKVVPDADPEVFAPEGVGNLDDPTEPDAAAYVIYTSGSTGRPKGVVVTHRNVANFFAAMDDALRPQRPGTWLAVTSISFDISVLELLWTLARGFRVVVQAEQGALVGAEEDDAADSSLAARLASHNVTHMQCTPSLAAALSTDSAALCALGSLDRLLLGGEELPAPLAERLRAKLAGELLNMYGPTETTVWSLTHTVAEPSRSVPIGRPVANTQVYVTDASVQLKPTRVPGEALLGGDGVARGYLNRPGLTAERFIPDPFGDRPGARLYRTGDLVRHMPDGVIEFLGRADHQVKIRGHRIEPGEIEAGLRLHPSVGEAVVVARESRPGEKRLTAYLVPANAGSNGAGARHAPRASHDFDTAGVQRFLKETLPAALVPSAFVILEELPRTPNGKIDRRSLPAPAAHGASRGEEYVAPRTPTEKELAEIWESLLGAERVGAHDNFFEAGGHSLAATLLATRIRSRFSVSLTLGTLFEYPTIAELAGLVEESILAKSGDDRVRELLSMLEGLDDEEALRLSGIDELPDTRPA